MGVLYITDYFRNNTFHKMAQSISITSDTCDNFLNENHKLKNLLMKLEKALAFLSLVFLKLEQMIHYIVIISKL